MGARRADRVRRRPVCEQFGTSATVVDGALFMLDQEGIIERQQGRGVFVAEFEKPRLKGVIGLQWGDGGTPDRSGHYGSDIILGIEQAAQRHGFELMLLSSSRTDHRAVVDGIVFADASKEQLTAAQAAQVSEVSILAESHDLPTVTADDFGGARLAVQYLVGPGASPDCLSSVGSCLTFAGQSFAWLCRRPRRCRHPGRSEMVTRAAVSLRVP